VHGSFGGVVSNDTVNDNFFFTLCEPSLLSTRPVGCLARPRRHEHIGGQANDKGKKALEGFSYESLMPMYANSYLNQEEPSPTRLTIDTSHVQQTIRKEAGEDICDRHASPEESEAKRKLMMFVKVRKIQNDLARLVIRVKQSCVISYIRDEPALEQAQQCATG
jgi:hypothetical protein